MQDGIDKFKFLLVLKDFEPQFKPIMGKTIKFLTCRTFHPLSSLRIAIYVSNILPDSVPPNHCKSNSLF